MVACCENILVFYAVIKGWHICPVLGFQSTSLALMNAAQHSVHPTGGSLRVFKQLAWLEVGSVKMALSCPTHQRVTLTVSLLSQRSKKNYEH